MGPSCPCALQNGKGFMIFSRLLSLKSISKPFLIEKRRFKQSRGIYLGLIGALLVGMGLAGCGAALLRVPVAVTVAASPTQIPTVATLTSAATASPPPAAAASPTPVPPTETLAPTHTPTPVVLVGAGDIAVCNSPGAEITAKLIEQLPDAAVFTAGDNTNELVTDPAPLKPCFDQTWGRFKERIRPAPGNHDYFYPGASDYFAYFGAAAGQPGQGWYSYDLGAWHIDVLNSECDQVGGCQTGSPQETWLKADLAAHPARCNLAIWHRPRYSSGYHGSLPATQDLWKDLYAAGAELVISGHDHDYERFAPMDAGGALDPAHGITQFVVGTGGVPVPGTIRPTHAANSQVIITGVYGVLKLNLRPDGYDWAFVADPAKPDTDAGSGMCH